MGRGVAQGFEGKETADKTAKKMALIFDPSSLFNFERTSDDQVHPSGRVIHKGVNPDIDSYSAFFDNAKLGKTNLEELIRKEVVFFLFEISFQDFFFEGDFFSPFFSFQGLQRCLCLWHCHRRVRW